MSRETRFIVYVDKAIMDKPVALFDACFAHLIKKELHIAKRKEFLAQFMKAYSDEMRFIVIDRWVQVRDVADFPYRKGQEDVPDDKSSEDVSSELFKHFMEENDENKETEGGVSVDEDGESESGDTSE